MVDKSIVGQEVGRGYMEVERGKVMEFARAILDENPHYFTDPAPLAPPTFTMAGAHWPQVEGGGSGMGEAFRALGLDLLRVLHAGQEFEYRGEIRAGDKLTSSSKIADVYEKEGKKGGSLLFVVSETTFTNQRGEDVLVSRNTIVQTSKAAS
jgi:hypothetical protein